MTITIKDYSSPTSTIITEPLIVKIDGGDIPKVKVYNGGIRGIEYLPGVPGPKGDKGDPGIQGIQGPAGSTLPGTTQEVLNLITGSIATTHLTNDLSSWISRTDTGLDQAKITLDLVEQNGLNMSQLITENSTSINALESGLLLQVARIDEAKSDIHLNYIAITDSILLQSERLDTVNQELYTTKIKLDDEITLQATHYNALTHDLTTTSILMNEAITLQASRIDDVEDEISTAVLLVDDSSIRLSVAEGSLSDYGNYIVAQQELLKNEWTVKIQENNDGSVYVAGIGLVVYEDWTENKVYEAFDCKWYDGVVYKCKISHTSSTSNMPPNTTYWEVLPNAAKSEFGVVADKFFIQTSSGNKINPFIVTDDQITINVPLVINSLEDAGVNPDATVGAIWDVNIVNQPDLSDFVTTTILTQSLEDLQDQIDGNYTSWYYEGVPTLSNIPAVDWADNATKHEHLGDLYYNTLTGAAYKFQYNTIYEWVQIPDTDLSAALAAAANAQDTADGKRRVFVTTPIGPYDVGDLWVENGLIKVALTARTSGYMLSDWGNGADTTADSNFVTTLYPADLDSIQTQIDGKVESWFQSTDPSTNWTTSAIKLTHAGDMWWNTSTNKLKRYDGTNWSTDLTDQTAISAFSNAATAQTTADSKMVVYTTTPSNYDVGDLWDVGGTPRILKRATTTRASFSASDWVTVANEITNTNQITDGAGLGNTAIWSYVSGSGKPADNATVGAPSGTYVAGTAADVIAADTTAAKIAVTAMESDSIFSIAEKRVWQINWPGMYANYTVMINAASAAGVSYTSFSNANTALYNFLYHTHGVFNSTPTNTALAQSSLTSLVSTYYSTMGDLSVAIAQAKASAALASANSYSNALDCAALINAKNTTINGGKITTGTIAAGTINVANLAAISANMGAITAGTMYLGGTSAYATGRGKFNVDVNGLIYTDSFYSYNIFSFGKIGAEKTIHTTGNESPMNGTGIELLYDSANSYGMVLCYDRSNSQFKKVKVVGLNLSLQAIGGNYLIGDVSAGTSAVGVITIKSATTAPTGNASGAGQLWVSSTGALMYRSPNGAVNQIAAG